MSLKYIEGDLLQYFNNGVFDVIGHGCNCFCTMGAGIAKSIKDAYPDVYELDCKSGKGKSKLGTIGVCEVKIAKDITIKNEQLRCEAQPKVALLPTNPPYPVPLVPKFEVVLSYIVNCYTQYGCGMKNGKAPIDYEAIRSCMKHIKAKFSGKKIGFPMIGAGLAGGDWKVISKIIEEELKGEDVTIVIYKATFGCASPSKTAPSVQQQFREMKEKVMDDCAERYRKNGGHY